MVDVDAAGLVRQEQNLYRQIAIADLVVVANMQILERARSWLKKCLENMQGYNSRMFESQRGVLFALPS